MPDRSSHQGLPEDWDHGSHTAHGPFSAPGASDGHGAGPTGSHRAGAADGYGTGPTAAYSGPSSDALGAGPDLFGTGKTDAYAIRPSDTYSAGAGGTFGAGAADAFAVRPSGSHGGGTIGGHGAGTADPFGNADPFGARNGEPFGNGDPFGARNGESFGNGDPFGSTPTAAFAAVTAEAGTARPAAERPAAAIDDPAAGEAGDVRGFLSALFDFGFTSFVAPKVIKVLYVLIVIGTVVSALVFTTIAFKASLVFGLLTLVFGDPLFILIVLAIYRIILEIFMVTFRAAEDIRALRERDERR